MQNKKGYKPVGKLDVAYDKIREATKGLTAPREVLANFVSKGEKMITGSSENIKIFLDILAKASEDAATAESLREEGSPGLSEGESATAPADFSQLKGYYSEIGDKLSGGNLPADVYRALRSVQSDIGGLMQKMADKRGVGQLHKTTQAQYRDFMQSFRESAGPNHSGSPLAQVLDAADPDYAIKPLTEEATAQRVRNMLSRFDPPKEGAGGAAQLYDNFRNAHRKYEGLGKPVKVPEPPSPPKLESPPKAPEPKTVDPPERVEPPDRPKPVEPKLHDTSPDAITALQKEGLNKQAQGIREYGIRRAMWSLGAAAPTAILTALMGHPGYAVGEIAIAVPAGISIMNMAARALENPALQDWLLNPPAKDIARIRALPIEQRATVMQNLKAISDAAREKGITVSSALAGAAAISGPKTRQLQDKSRELRGEQ
jgi:hypothetical protein